MSFIYPTVATVTENLRGLYRIDHEAYHAGPGISSSDVKNALISYGYFKAKKDSDDDDDTAAKRLGRAVHMAVLEPGLFRERVVVMPKFDRRTNAGKANYESWAQLHAGKEIIDQDQFDTVVAVSLAVEKHPLWASLKGYVAEVMGITRCTETGLLIKCKADLFGGAIIDLKTTECAAPGEFRRSVLKFGYHVSAAFYQDLYKELTGQLMPFIHVVAEKKSPHGVAFYSMSDDFLEEGRKLYKAGIRRIARWNGLDEKKRELHYGDKIKTLHLTPPVLYRTNEVLAEIEEELA